MSNSPAPYTFRDLAFVPVRTLVMIPFVVLAFICDFLKMLGHWGDLLGDLCVNVNRAATIHLNPRAWDLFKQYKEERDSLESKVRFWEGQAKYYEGEYNKVAPNPPLEGEPL